MTKSGPDQRVLANRSNDAIQRLANAGQAGETAIPPGYGIDFLDSIRGLPPTQSDRPPLIVPPVTGSPQQRVPNAAEPHTQPGAVLPAQGKITPILPSMAPAQPSPVAVPAQSQEAGRLMTTAPADAAGASRENSSVQVGSKAATATIAAESASHTTAGPAAATAQATSTDASLDALATSDVALIDEELAEHQRWGAAVERVGAAGSDTRARFLAQQADAGLVGGGAQAFATGAGMGAATRALEIGGERAAIRLAGQAAGRAAPIPAIGAVIGGVMSAMDLAERDWSQTGQTIGRFGQGASDYETLANSIAAVSEIISVYTSVLNVIAGVIGAISIAMWVITVVTVGVASPLAVTLSTIAAAIGIATMILDGINSLVLQPLVTTFRALHAFKSQADPTQVEEQGAQVRQAAAAGAGFVGGFAGGMAGSHGASAAGRRLGVVPPHAPATPHETPPPAAGDGPTIIAEPPPAGPHEPAAFAEPSRSATGEAVAPLAAETVPSGRPKAEPTQLSFGPEFEQPGRGKGRRLTPDEVAPPNTHSALLRRWRSEAAGQPPPAVGTGSQNIARHLLPDAGYGQPGTSFNTTSPTPDLYQHTPRRPGSRNTPSEHQSHHAELQSLLRDAIAEYNPNEDVTVMLRQRPEHEAVSAGQKPLYDPINRATTTRELGTSVGLEKAYNLLLWGDANGPHTPGQTPMMDPHVAGQLIMEHSAYLFETTRLSNTNEPVAGARVRPGEPLLTDRPVVGDLLRSRGETVVPFEGIDWDSTFNQPDPHALAQSPGTQFDLFGRHQPPAPVLFEQLSLRLREASDPRQMDLFSPRSVMPEGDVPPGGRSGGDTLAMAEPVGPGATARPPMRSTRALTPVERSQLIQMAAEMGYPPERVVFHDGQTSVRNGELRIGPDVNPLPHEQRSTGLANPANLAVEARGVIGHEVIGHLEAAAGGQRQPLRSREEFQASTRAALHTPALPPDQMRLLMSDASARLRNDPQTGTFYIYTDRPQAALARQSSRPAGHFRPQDRLPSVIVDRRALGMPSSDASPAGAARLPMALQRGEPPPPASSPQRFAGGGAALPKPARAAPSGFGAAVDRMRQGYVGTVAAGLWSAVPGVEQVHRVGRVGSDWFGDERLRPSPSRRDAAGNAVDYSRNERSVIGVGGGVGMGLGTLAGGPLGGYLGRRVGEGVARRSADFADGLTRGAREPIIERVSPVYPAPPEGGYDQINALQERLARILEARAQAEAAEQSARGDASHHQANVAPLTQFDQRATQSISATQAHQAATERRQQANAQRQEREGEVSTKLADAAQRRSGLSVLTVPLRGFQRFSSLGDSMPDGVPLSPTALVGPKRKIRQLNRDATDFLKALDGVDRTISDQQAQTGPRRQEAAQQGGRLNAAQADATTSQASLQSTSVQGQAIAQRNQQRIDESRQTAGNAAAQGARLDGEAQRTQTQMQTAEQRWQGWAQAHRQARLRAIEQRRQALEALGYRVRGVSER